jgi:hypothetical protein
MEVIEVVNGQPIAHLLPPGKQSPATADPIALKGADCEIWISEQRYWMVPPGELLVVSDGAPGHGGDRVTLNLDQDSTASYEPESFEAKFGTISYDLVSKGEDWGEPLGRDVPSPADEQALRHDPKQQSQLWQREADKNLDQFYYKEIKTEGNVVKVVDHTLISYRQLTYGDFAYTELAGKYRNKGIILAKTVSFVGVGVCLDFQFSLAGPIGRMTVTLKAIAFRAFFDATGSCWAGKELSLLLEDEQGHLDIYEIRARILNLNVNRENIIKKAGSVEVEVGKEGITDQQKQEAVQKMRDKVTDLVLDKDGSLKKWLPGTYHVMSDSYYDENAADPKTHVIDAKRQRPLTKQIQGLLSRLKNELEVQPPL